MSVLRPSGPEPARVYWVRRVVVLAVLVLVVVLVVIGIRALTSGSDDGAEPSGGTTQTTPVAPVESPGTTADDGTPDCTPADLGVTLAADGTSYPAGALPTFTVSIVNNGTEPCLVDAGDLQRSILITSGSDRIWASTDCTPTDAAPLQLLLGPGQPDERTVQWDRSRSAEGCPADQGTPRAGTYQAVLTLAGVTSEPVVFGLE
jgi:hypothetical protein